MSTMAHNTGQRYGNKKLRHHYNKASENGADFAGKAELWLISLSKLIISDYDWLLLLL